MSNLLTKSLLTAYSAAVCLDGTPAGYYARFNSSSPDWVIFFEGGGWCYKYDDCVERANSTLGSSKDWPATRGTSGPLSPDCSINPQFCYANAVYAKYCDGASFSGAQQQPQGEKGLHFRGHAILESLLDELSAKGGLSKSTGKVLMTGSSAGGLATFLHADYVGARVPGARFVALPISGFFLDANNVDGEPVYGTEMRHVYHMQNATVNAACQAAQGENCMLAEVVIDYIKSQLLIFNSVYDSWQMGNIWLINAEDKPAVGDLRACLHTPDTCSKEALALATTFAKELLAKLKSRIAATKASAFLTSCISHACGGSDYCFHDLTTQGHTLQGELAAILAGGPSTQRVALPQCMQGAQYPCNPSCAQALEWSEAW